MESMELVICLAWRFICRICLWGEVMLWLLFVSENSCVLTVKLIAQATEFCCILRIFWFKINYKGTNFGTQKKWLRWCVESSFIGGLSALWPIHWCHIIQVTIFSHNPESLHSCCLIGWKFVGWNEFGWWDGWYWYMIILEYLCVHELILVYDKYKIL